MIVIEALDDGGKGRNVASRLVPTALAARQLFVQVSRPSPGGTATGERCRCRTFGRRLSTLTRPKVECWRKLPLPVRESRGGSSNSSLSTSATRTRDGPKTGQQGNQYAVDENSGRRFPGWDISANVGVKLHAR